MSPVSMNLEAALSASGGTLIQRGAPSFTGASIDSRQVHAGQAFFAIAGARFDGHDFWPQAATAGAALLIVARPLVGKVPEEISVIRVADTRLALGALGRVWRRRIAPRVVAITGSVGKTTTKEFAARVLARAGSTHSTTGNFNNDLGVPLTLLAMDAATKYLVVELGMNAAGEIATLTGLTEPDVGVITCIAPVHLEGLGSLEAVAAAKGELLAGLGPDGWAVVPGEEPLLDPHLRGIPASRRLRFGGRETDEIQIKQVRYRGEKGTEVRLSLQGQEVAFVLPLPGEHNTRNAAAAAAVGMILGVAAADIAAALGERPHLEHRSVVRCLGPWHVFDDCYNANPVAVKAALDTLMQLAEGNQAIAVLGRMLELGLRSPQYHREVGAYAASKGLSLLLTVGPMAAEIASGAREAGMPAERILHVEEPSQVSEVLARHAAPGTWILVKASRGARLEVVVEGLATLAGETPLADEKLGR